MGQWERVVWCGRVCYGVEMYGKVGKSMVRWARVW